MNTKDKVELIESEILSMRNHQGVWDGELSSSALSTATAIFALYKYDKTKYSQYIENGIDWLRRNVNADGGFGDSVKSESNMSTTLLVWSAISIVKDRDEYSNFILLIESWLLHHAGSLEPKSISSSILSHYKEDLTFSAPILAFCALAGRLGSDGWRYVPQLPFQFAALPNSFFRLMNLNVVSYAIPALISIGLVRYRSRPSKNPIVRLINKMVTPKVLRVLDDKQPSNGGFLEAAPLTSFVLMSLVDAGFADLDVCKKAVSFLENSIRQDGSWPIDTNLSTWVTTLAVNSFSDESIGNIDKNSKDKILSWLTNQQFKDIHPFTKSAPGGWAWTNLPGGAPDADDTSGALIALKRLSNDDIQSRLAAQNGIEWLLGVQNSDGGIPTFCRGWGKLPFDCSCPDITAHALRAFLVWYNVVDDELKNKITTSIQRMVKYLKTKQQDDGSWLPLWFGNQDDKGKANPVYGTSLVLYGLKEAMKSDVAHLDDMVSRGKAFLVGVQNSDGGWGGNLNIQSSIEETSLAVKAMACFGKSSELSNGAEWLKKHCFEEGHIVMPAKPIGLYFASLWYFEKMYPYTFACSALNEVSKIEKLN